MKGKFSKSLLAFFSAFMFVALSSGALADDAPVAAGAPSEMSVAPVIAIAEEGHGLSAPDLRAGAEEVLEVPKPFDEELAQSKAQLESEGLEPYDSMAAADQPDGVGVEVDQSAEDTSNDAAGALAPSAPSLLRNFDGINDTGSFPPDPIIAAGPNRIVVMVNRSWAIYDKNGTRRFQTTFSNWWRGEAGNPFDPWCFYDQHAGRFVMLTVAMNSSRSISQYLISVSDNSDPLGTWYNYVIRADSIGSTLNNTWADYPKIGYDDGFAVYITANMFTSSFQYSQMRVIRKSQLYAGAAISWFDFRNFRNGDGSLAFTLQPANALSRPGRMFLVNTESRLSGNAITLWQATKTWPPNVTRRATIPIGSYSNPPDAVQRGSSRRIDTGDSRLYNAYYRMNRIFTAFPVAFNWGSGTVSALRYVVFNPFSLVRQFDITYGANSRYYYFPAIVPDRSNNIGIVFNRSGSSEYGSARYTARLTTDSSTQSSAYLRAGMAPYVQLDSIGRNRWGDYSGAALDPSTGCTWLYSEYAGTSNTWRTRVGEVCLRAAAPPCNLSSKFQRTSMVVGQTYYTDRAYRITGGVPSWMVGRTLIRTPNDERFNNAASGYLRFTTPVSWWVYVLFDSRASNKPNWLDQGGWVRRSNRILTSLGSQPYLEVWRKMFTAGQCVDLGGNFGPGSSGENRSNYAVVYGAP